MDSEKRIPGVSTTAFFPPIKCDHNNNTSDNRQSLLGYFDVSGILQKLMFR